MRATFWPSIFPLPFIKFPIKLSKLARLKHSRFFFSQVSILKKTRFEFGRKHFLLFKEMLLSSWYVRIVNSGCYFAGAHLDDYHAVLNQNP